MSETPTGRPRTIVLDAIWATADADPKFDGVGRDEPGFVIERLDSLGHVDWMGYLEDGVRKATGVKPRMDAVGAFAWAKERGLKNPFLDLDSMVGYVAWLLPGGKEQPVDPDIPKARPDDPGSMYDESRMTRREAGDERE